MPRLLVICRQPDDLPAVRRHLAADVIVATDHPGVREAVRALGVREVRHLEPPVAFYAVADEVRRLLREVNSRLTPLRPPGSHLPESVWRWSPNIEGGHTSQRLQDAALLVNSGLALLDETRPKAVLLAGRPDCLFEDSVLAECCLHRGIPVTLAGRLKPIRWLARARERLRPWAFACYYLWAVLREKYSLSPREIVPLDGTVVFQVCGSASKHVENVRPLMRALAARGEKVAALCWAASERATPRSACRQLRESGLAALALERCVGAGALLASLRPLFRRQPELTGLACQGVPLTNILRPAVTHFLIADLPQRMRYAAALRVVLTSSRPVALKPWGGPDIFEGEAALDLLPDTHPPALVFHYWLGAALPWPYVPDRPRLDLFLAKGPAEIPLARACYGLAERGVAVVGQSRLPDYTAFIARTSKEESRRALGLPPEARRYLGFDPNCVLRGYQSAFEQTVMLESLLAVADAMPDTVVVIKPHPSYPIGHLLPVIGARPRSNVFVLSRTAPLDHFLNAIDLLVTKYSSLILEAALCGRPSLVALLDGENRFLVYGALPEAVTSSAALTARLQQLAQDDAAFADWCAAFRQRAAGILPDHLHQQPRPPAEVAADAILARRAAG